MPPVESAATVLSTIAYGETSRVARLATAELGVVSVIAKGARRPRSRFGAALQVLSEGVASILPARASDLHVLTAFDVTRVRSGLAADLERYTVASALGELVLRCGAQEGHRETYAFFRHALDLLEMAPPETVGVLGLRMLWGLVAHLGFAPSLDRCVRDGLPIDPALEAAFSAREGGVLCPRCARGVEATRLTPANLADLGVLIRGNGDLPALDVRHQRAHRRLLDHYIRHHVAEGLPLTALAFWADRSWRGDAR